MVEPSAILDAALDLFERQSFGATTVPALAEHAGVAVGSIYRHYPSKDALANAIYQRWKRELAAVLAADRPVGDDRATFAHFWQRLTQFACDHPQALSFLETHSHAPYLDAESIALARAVDQYVERFVRDAQRNGTIRRGRPEHIVAFVFGAFVGVFSKCATVRSSARRTTLASFEDVAWAAISVAGAPDP